MRFLVLGISIGAFFLNKSCKSRIDYFVRGTFIYVNDTDSSIEVKNAPYQFIVEPNEYYSIEQSGEGSKVLNEKNYVAPFTGGQIIIYGKNLCDTLLVPKEGISGIENYKSEKVGDRHYKFTYTFTDEDVKKAVPCN